MNKYLLYITILLALCFSLSYSQPQNDIANSRQNAITNAISKVSPAVAGINVTELKEINTNRYMNDSFFSLLFPDMIQRKKVTSLGSGVVISPDGYIVTNAHVVQNAQEIIVTLMKGIEYKAQLVGIDKMADIALLKIKSENDLIFAKLGQSDDIIIGEWSIALGNPFGLFDISFKPTATVGVISGTDMDFGLQRSGKVYQDMIQTDAAINTGNSGGPLVNANGEVIGINTFIFTGGQYDKGSAGVGFAIPINRIKEIVLELKKYGKVNRSFKTGLAVQNIDPAIARYLKLPTDHGVIVTEVKVNSAGSRSGIKVGDVLLNINERKIKRDSDIIELIQENFYKSGDSIKFTVLRGQDEFFIDLELE